MQVASGSGLSGRGVLPAALFPVAVVSQDQLVVQLFNRLVVQLDPGQVGKWLAVLAVCDLHRAASKLVAGGVPALAFRRIGHCGKRTGRPSPSRGETRRP